MYFFRREKTRTVSDRGAAAGDILCGSGENNQGLRLRVSQDQSRGSGGPIQGSFVILDAGDGRHAESLAALLHRPTDADAVRDATRRQSAACVNVVNANILSV